MEHFRCVLYREYDSLILKRACFVKTALASCHRNLFQFHLRLKQLPIKYNHLKNHMKINLNIVLIETSLKKAWYPIYMLSMTILIKWEKIQNQKDKTTYLFILFWYRTQIVLTNWIQYFLFTSSNIKLARNYRMRMAIHFRHP